MTSKIEKINDLELLRTLQEKLLITKEQIKKYSLYKMDDIAEAILKVISAFEGIEYMSVRYKFNLDENLIYNSNNLKESVGVDYPAIHIIPKTKASDDYARYRLMYKRDQNDKNICYLPPSYYTPHKKCYYIKDFINYLYVKKVENNIINSREFYLKIADEFINENKDEIRNRQQMIKKSYQKKLEPSPIRNELLSNHLYWM